MYLEALVITQLDYTIYFVVLTVIGVSAYLTFYCYFDIKSNDLNVV